MALVGYLSAGAQGPDFGYFKDGLRKLGYTEGTNLRIERRSAAGKPARLAALAAELVALKVDILLAHRLSAFSPFGNFPVEGGLVSYSANQLEMHEGVPRYVDRILKGAKPVQ